ncbi:MAG: hypothetical protein UIC45_06270 [Paludibacteraceae bacterium]|nr:hypothetical protein [Paludibacteraceae bacterium]
MNTRVHNLTYGVVDAKVCICRYCATRCCDVCIGYTTKVVKINGFYYF